MLYPRSGPRQPDHGLADFKSFSPALKFAGFFVLALILFWCGGKPRGVWPPGRSSRLCRLIGR